MNDRLAENIEFWSLQMEEHMLFITLGLANEELRQESYNIYLYWQAFRNRDETVSLGDIMTVTGQYKTKVLEILKSGKWIGWLFPSFLQHILDEYNYFENILLGKTLSAQEEMKFWNKINKEHIAMVKQMCDPEAKAMIELSQNFVDNFEKIPQNDFTQMIILSKRLTSSLGQFQKEMREHGKVMQSQTILHPKILDHMIRENERSILILNGLSQ